MCQATPCRTCGKTTWAGCGSHVDEVRASVPPQDWCPGHAASAAPGAAAAAPERPRRRSWFG